MMKRTGMFLLALVGGYVAMIAGIFLVQEGMFGGVGYQKTPLSQLLIAGALTMVAAAAGGAVVALIFRKPYYPPAVVMCCMVGAETVYMTLAGRIPGPVWFDALASGSLIVGILVGVFLVSRWNDSPTTGDRVAVEGH